MQITVPDNDKLQNQAIAAGFVSLEQYIIELLVRDADRIAIQQGLDDIKVGRVTSAVEVEANIHKDFGLPLKT